ncbi:PREDICTED: geranylgeranyl transferase type-2 subunit alpha-like [Vollenhovia emeryi]|uniref:geranylgeranyl transferase type-2 subunit alpha-like n=1 Tax=Vollenhovia emeryi TaxID=411798 RepID=UPI0005F3BF81|nr:PREDICTED: geranylgeranyl transferase type-2 subunit alpha-like [Vollenhovia emeryi]XP_011881515.1 PREDICTED: geranylgeranyl transferase type-2 subunit alpha-like [Vollenhovia emeryi]
MHGRVKVRTTAEQEEIKKQERAVKVAQYKADFAIVAQKRNILEIKKWGLELLNVTKRILLNNSDIYTLWNVRRQVFENKKWSEVDYKLLLENEMILTERCLRENPKSYSLWHQRCWVMERMPEPDWKKELSMCAECLNLDERNFHCWDYREFVVQKAGISNEEEFEFSTTKILSNFSNYSSWHYRSRILTKMFGTTSEEIPIVDDRYREELDLVMNATFTDPNDTSAWFYQRWLLDKPRTTCRLWRAQIEKDRATVVIDNNVLIQPISLELFVNGEMVDLISWHLYPDEEFAKLRIEEFAKSLENLDHAKEVSVKLQETVYQLSYSELKSAWIYKDNSSLHKQNSNDKQLNEQLKCYNQLCEMEPNNKWALLTGVLLMKKIDFKKFYTDILDNLSALTKVDSLRKNYYKDLRSSFLVEYKLLEIWKEESDLEIQPKIDLSGLDLTKLHNNHYFSFFEEVNFGANQLKNSLYQLSTLQSCVKLSLSSNGLTSLKHFPTLDNLEVLSLRNNMLTSTKEIVDLIELHTTLRRLDLRNNPVCEKIDIAEIQDISPHVEICLK